MRLEKFTLEQLEDMELELLEQGEQTDGYYARILQVYKVMYKKLGLLVKENSGEYDDNLHYIKKKLIAYYIKYGTYLKFSHVKDTGTAINSLKQAIALDKYNPIAHYRLGFLSYRAEEYVDALYFLQKAINSQEIYENRDYLLNDQQLFNAHMYLTNSALYVASQTYKNMERLKWEDSSNLPSYEISPMFALLSENESYLSEHAFYQVNNNQIGKCSLETANNIIENPPESTLVLYFGDRGIVGAFDRKEVVFSIDLAEFFRHMLMNCSEDQPGTRFTLRHYFNNLDSNGEVISATFRKKIQRLREKLVRIGLKDAIQQTRYREETAYYVNGKLDYIVLFRVDDFISSELINL